MRQMLRLMFLAIFDPHTPSELDWPLVLMTAFMGAGLMSSFGWLLSGLVYESGNTLPAIIFSALMTTGGLFILSGAVVEGLKKTPRFQRIVFIITK